MVIFDPAQHDELYRLLDVTVRFQDRKYDAPLGPDVILVRGAIGFLQDEIEEARQAWHEDSRPGSEPWARTAEEVMQVAAIAMRLLRDLGVGRRHG